MKKTIPIILLSLVVFYGQSLCAAEPVERLNKEQVFNKAKYLYQSKKYREAFKLFLGLSEQGNSKAMMSLGYMLETGQGVMPNIAKSLYWYRMAAQNQYPPAFTKLGVLYQEGKKVRRNLVLANALQQVADVYSHSDVSMAMVKITGELLSESEKEKAKAISTKLLNKPYDAAAIIRYESKKGSSLL